MSERWEIDWEGNRILAKDERKSIICHMGGNLRNPEVAKDAYLIAASGDLLEALEASLICLEWWRTRYPMDASGKEASVIANAQAALKKVKP